MSYDYICVDDAINDLDNRLCFLLGDFPSNEEKVSFDGKLVLTLTHLEKNELFGVPLKVINLEDLLTGGDFITAIFQRPSEKFNLVGNFEMNGVQKKYVAEFYCL